MELPAVFNLMSNTLQDAQTGQLRLLECEFQKHGIRLREAEAREILEVRKRVLQGCGRIELDIGVTQKLIESFGASPFIPPEDLVAVLHELHELFYYMKNETEDKIGDEALIGMMREYFETSCGGSMELLKGREMEGFSAYVRHQNQIEEYQDKDL